MALDGCIYIDAIYMHTTQWNSSEQFQLTVHSITLSSKQFRNSSSALKLILMTGSSNRTVIKIFYGKPMQ